MVDYIGGTWTPRSKELNCIEKGSRRMAGHALNEAKLNKKLRAELEEKGDRGAVER